jgi:hypothetical protein
MHRLLSQTYATKSCLPTVVAMRRQVPMDKSVQGIIVTAKMRRVVSIIALTSCSSWTYVRLRVSSCEDPPQTQRTALVACLAVFPRYHFAPYFFRPAVLLSLVYDKYEN